MASIKGGKIFQDRLKDIIAMATRGSNKKVRVGFLSKSAYTYPNGMTTPTIAAIHEFGAPSVGIPPRPFFRQMITKQKPGWPTMIQEELVRNNFDTELTLRRVGAVIQGQLIEEINEFTGVPLKPATIARKGFDKQLIDTAHMKNSVDYELI